MMQLVTMCKMHVWCMLLIAVSTTMQAQGPLHASQWIFGQEAWVDFSADTPVVRRAPGFFAGEPSTSFSDPSGNLLWYSDGYGVLDREHQYMSNGVFYDTVLASNYTFTQGVLALPNPGNLNQSYIIFLQGDYSVVDHEGNAGKGSIVGPPFLRNWWDGAFSLGTEKMQAIKHANGRDWWILNLLAPGTIDTPQVPKLAVSLLDNTGIHAVHKVDLGLPKSRFIDWVTGDLKASYDGTRLVFAGMKEQGVRLYGFDRCTGLPGPAFDSVFLDSPGYSLEFSRSGEFVYIGAGNELWQWQPNADQVDSNLYLIETIPPLYFFAGLLRARDERIFVSTGHLFYPSSSSFTLSIFNKSLSTIKHPEISGLACTFDEATINLDSGVALKGLPNFANYALGALEGSPCDTLSGGGTAIAGPSPEAEVMLHPNPTKQEWRLSGLQERDYVYSIFDAMGREVHSGVWTAGSPHRVSAIDLPSGWYVVHVQHAGSLVWRGSALRQ